MTVSLFFVTLSVYLFLAMHFIYYILLNITRPSAGIFYLILFML